jgi:hypothetical protein
MAIVSYTIRMMVAHNGCRFFRLAADMQQHARNVPHPIKIRHSTTEWCRHGRPKVVSKLTHLIKTGAQEYKVSAETVHVQ